MRLVDGLEHMHDRPAGGIHLVHAEITVAQRDDRMALSERSDRAKEHEWLGQVTVRDVMTKEVTAIGSEAGVVEAVDKLVTAKFG